MRLTIAQLRAAGVSDKQIVDALAEADAERREKERIKKRIQRARPQSPGDGGDTRDSHIKKEVSKKERKGRKTVMPVDWRPTVSEEDSSEFERFANYCKANAKLYADWDAAWRNWRTSPYRGGQNGSLHVRSSGQQAGGLSDAIAKVRSRLRDGQSGFADVVVPQDRLPKPRGFYSDPGSNSGGLSGGDRGIHHRPENRPATPLQMAADASGSGGSVRSGNQLANENSPELKLVAGTEITAAKIQYGG